MLIPVINSKNKGKAILVGYLIFSFLYIISSKYYLHSPIQLNHTILDEFIPFVPATIIIYLSQFLFLFLSLYKGDDVARKTKIYYAMLLSTIAATSIFLIMPVELPRQNIQFQGVLGVLWQGLYLTDTSLNCFPSLHVALALLAAIVMMEINTFWRYIAPLWALLICLSTLTTKQHYAIDVLGGVVLAILSLSVVNSKIMVKHVYAKHY